MGVPVMDDGLTDIPDKSSTNAGMEMRSSQKKTI